MFTKIKSPALVIRDENVDTDQIIPTRFLNVTTKAGFGNKLFYEWRYDENGNEMPSVFNKPSSKKAKTLIVEKNFGIGSSREHAVWALKDYGFRVIIGSSFGDIFYLNCLKNGILIVKLEKRKVSEIMKIVEENDTAMIVTDLEKQLVLFPWGRAYQFSIDPFRKLCLLKGINEISYIQRREEFIQAYEQSYPHYS